MKICYSEGAVVVKRLCRDDTFFMWNTIADV